MKRLVKKTKGLIKGTPVAVLVSIGIHALLIFFAIGWVVFKFAKSEPPAFVPPEKINRPTMKLKKPQVVVKDNAKPKQSTDRIVSKADLTTANIVLPEMTAGGIGDGLGDAIGGFQMMEDLAKMTLMGGEASLGNDLVGTYYYLMQNRAGGDSNIDSGTGNELYNDAIAKFFDSGWDPAAFDGYWRAPIKLYATQVFIPPVISRRAPEYFGDSRRVEAAYWLVHYKGKIGFPEDLKEDYPNGASFRFWGYADNILFVRINGEIILNGCYSRNYPEWPDYWTPTAYENRRYPSISNGSDKWRVSDWFEMTPDEPVDIEILIGEQPGGGFTAMLCVQQEGVEYSDRDWLPGPLLPIFKTAPMPQHIVDEISYLLPPGVVDITGGPIFSTY